MPTAVCRARIMRMRNDLYPAHTDKYPRIHVPIISFPGNNNNAIEATGDIYWVDAENCHRFVNYGQHPRIHIMMSIVDNTYKPT